VKIKFIFVDLDQESRHEVWRLDHLPRKGETVVDDDERIWWVVGVNYRPDALTEVQLSSTQGK
jgi:hypothetical protein